VPALEEGGVIVNMASIAGLGANEMMGCAYTASKHAIIGMTKTAAREYAAKGIRFNALCPGVIETEIAQRSLLHDETFKRRVLKMHPIGRLGTVGEVTGDNRKEILQGDVDLKLASTDSDPLGEIPVQGIVSSTYTLGDITLNHGEVIHDYLAGGS